MYLLLEKTLHAADSCIPAPCCSRVKYKRTRRSKKIYQKLLQWSGGDDWQVEVEMEGEASWEYLSGWSQEGEREKDKVRGSNTPRFWFKQLGGWWHCFDMDQAQREATLRRKLKLNNLAKILIPLPQLFMTLGPQMSAPRSLPQRLHTAPAPSSLFPLGLILSSLHLLFAIIWSFD